MEKVTVSAFLRRRLIVVLQSLKFCENLDLAQKYVEHGHVVVGNKVIRDGDYLVARKMEDYIKWRSGSKIKRKIMEF